MQRLIVRIFMSLLFYNTSVWIVGRLADALGYLFVKGGSSDLWQLFHQHPFGRAILVGFLAGWVPLETWLAASGLMNRRIKLHLRRLKLNRLKQWIVVIYSPVLLFVFGGWTIQWFENRGQYSSVLQTASGYPASEFFRGFLSIDCAKAGGIGESFWGGNALSCMIHVQLISIWLFAVGYSLAPLARKRVFPIFETEHPVSMDEVPDEKGHEITITEMNETK
jgi:hypothetical protein